MPGIKNAIRKVLPLRTSTFGKAKAEISTKIDKLQEQIAESQTDSIRELELRLESIERQLDGITSSVNHLQKTVDATRLNAWNAFTSAQEVVFAESFRSATAGCEWLRDAAFNPGRWAVGYQFLYVLFHVLNDVQPKRILDLGLGQTTNMISRYASSHEGVVHDVVEHDEQWIEFYRSEHGLCENTHITKLNLTTEEREGCSSPVRVYDGFREVFGDKKYNLISIDAPFGYDMHDLSRVDVLGLMPGILEESFVILLDDYNRDGEQHTAELMRQSLAEAGIEFSEGMYQGSKRVLVLCSKDWSFLASV